MALAIKATVTTMSSKPCSRSSVTTCSIMGRLAIGSIGFGRFEVSGRKRVPSPPAMITAFIGDLASGRSNSRDAPSRGPYPAPDPQLVGTGHGWDKPGSTFGRRFWPGAAPPKRCPGDGHVRERGHPGKGQAGDRTYPGKYLDGVLPAGMAVGHQE